MSGRGPDNRTLSLWGLGMIALIMIIATPVFLYARGAFESNVSVTVVSTRVADTLSSGADVKYRGLLVGRVDAVDVTADGRQRMHIDLEPGAAKDIGGDITARFVPSNIFGVVGIELVSSTSGGRLRDGAQIAMSPDSATVSAIAVLRDIGSVTTTLTGDDVTAMINRLDTVVDQLSPLISGGFDLFNLAHTHQRMPFADFLSIAADTLHGADRMTEPFVDLFTTLVEKTEMYADPVQTERVTGALTGLVQTFITLGQVVGANPREMATMLDASLTLGAPLGHTLSTVPRAAERLPELLTRLEKSMPIVDGRVRLRLGMTLASLPQITSVLAQTGGGVR